MRYSRSRARRLAEQRDRLFGVQQVFEEEPASNNVMSSTTSTETGDIGEDLETCDNLPRSLRRRLHEMVCSFSAKSVAAHIGIRHPSEILYNLNLNEKRELEQFYIERGLVYVGTVCRYYSRRVYNQAQRTYR